MTFLLFSFRSYRKNRATFQVAWYGMYISHWNAQTQNQTQAESLLRVPLFPFIVPLLILNSFSALWQQELMQRPRLGFLKFQKEDFPIFDIPSWLIVSFFCKFYWISILMRTNDTLCLFLCCYSSPQSDVYCPLITDIKNGGWVRHRSVFSLSLVMDTPASQWFSLDS